MSEPCDLTAVEARRRIGTKELSPVELLDSCLDRIEKTNGTLNAMVAMDVEAAREDAEKAEASVMSGDDLDLLHGLPIGVKDLQATAGLRTTYGSLLYEDTVPEEDDPMVANVRASGGVILGKTNTPEFGAGANTTNRVFGATGNPFDPSKTCGGSSGGSAVALAAGMVPLATGSDHGGSLRTPAGYCGVVGFRPSPGVVPGTTRPVALSPSSVLGPMGRTVADTHLLLKAQLDYDKRDPFSSGDGLGIPDTLAGADLSSLRAAISTDLGVAPIDNAIRDVFETKVSAFRHVFAEAQARDPDLGDVHDAFEVQRGVLFVAAHAERLENHRDLLGPNVIDNTERGLEYSASDVARAYTEQSKIYKNFLGFFADSDVLICPATSISPFPHEQRYVDEMNGEKMPTYMRWLAISYGLTMAIPCACVIPCGVDHLGMPFGIQIVGPNGSDAFILEVAHSLEQVLADMAETKRPVADPSSLTS